MFEKNRFFRKNQRGSDLLSRPMSGGFNNQPILISIYVCLFVLCILFIFLSFIFVFNFVFTLFPCLHSFVLYFCISNFKTFIFRLLLYLYDLRFFPMLFFFYLSVSSILLSSLPTLLSLILPFFLLRNRSLPNIFLYFLLIFCFHFSVFLNIVLHHPLRTANSTHFTSSTLFLII